MEYFLTEDQKMIQGLARRIAEEKILPVRAELDETEEEYMETLYKGESVLRSLGFDLREGFEI